MQHYNKFYKPDDFIQHQVPAKESVECKFTGQGIGEKASTMERYKRKRGNRMVGKTEVKTPMHLGVETDVAETNQKHLVNYMFRFISKRVNKIPKYQKKVCK